MLICHLCIKTVNIHEKNQCGGVWGREGGAKLHPPLDGIPFPSDSAPFSLTNCLPLRQIPLAEYSMGVQLRRLGSISPHPIFKKSWGGAKSVIFINIWQKLRVSPSGILPQVFTTYNIVFIIVHVHIV